MKRNLFVLCVLACFCVVSTGAYAQPAASSEEPISTNIPPNAGITASTSAVWWSEIGSTTVEVASSEVKVGVEIPFVKLGYKYRHYDWNHISNGRLGIRNTDPWNDLHQFSLDLADTRIVYDEQWGYSARVGVASSFEQQMSRSFSYQAEAGLVYEYDENFMIIAGAMFQWYETDYWVIPTGSIRYRAFADEGLSIVVGLPESFISYQLDNGLGLKALWKYEKDVYRLENSNIYSRRGYIETWGQVLGLEGSWIINENVKLVGGVTYNIDRDYKRFNKGGNRDFTNKIDNQFGMTGGVSITF